MNYSKKAYQDAMNTLRTRRLEAESEAHERRAQFIKQHPELVMLENEMAKTGLAAAKSILGCDDPKAYIEKLKNKNLAYQKARQDLFKSAGTDENYLKPQYTCEKCNDTGFCDGEMCSCLESLLKQEAFKELAECTPLKISNFSDFDVSLYDSPQAKKKMKDIFDYCIDYANAFDLNNPSLFMCGETGLGKTHLSLAIAGKVIEKGYGVVYGSAQNLLGMIEREKFGRSENPDGTTEEKLLCCDLLILDDLGAEFSTPFTVAEIYNIINTRMAKELPTIISSNVKIEELEKRYSSRVTSRIIGTYEMLNFIGNDIRQIKG